MSTDGPEELLQIPSRHFSSKDYLRVLENELLESVRAIYDNNANIVLIQNNSPIHTAHVVNNWFMEQPFIQVLKWSSKFPDVNPIENLWAIMVQQ